MISAHVISTIQHSISTIQHFISTIQHFISTIQPSISTSPPFGAGRSSRLEVFTEPRHHLPGGRPRHWIAPPSGYRAQRLTSAPRPARQLPTEPDVNFIPTVTGG